MKKILSLLLLSSPAIAFAEGPPKPSELNNTLAVTLLVVIIGLLLVVGTLAYVVLGAAQVYMQRLKEKTTAKLLSVIALCLLSVSSFAQDASAEATTEAVTRVTSIGGMSTFSFYTMVSVIALELVLIMVLLFHLKRLLAVEKATIHAVVEAIKKPSVLKVWWAKMNSFKPIEQEADIALHHNYDGIVELDNRLPPWWLYGFYITIIFSGIYMYRYHVSKTAPLSEQELAISLKKAEVEKEAYLKGAANKVDENTVTLLTDASALEAGKKMFTTNCAACHAPDGGGIVGPNLTDEYWLHGGSLKDVFKIIKYGVQEKGMKSWKDDFSPVQIAQLTSYIKTLHRTKPANPKEPQGDIFKENAGVDSTNKKIAAL
jgi:cytochrome c oxidase cbb3-type subunit 3